MNDQELALVLSLVDDTHPSATEVLDDAVVRDGLADHSAQGCNVRGAYEASQQNGGTLCLDSDEKLAAHALWYCALRRGHRNFTSFSQSHAATKI
jgi:hypothetical protein